MIRKSQANTLRNIKDNYEEQLKMRTCSWPWVWTRVRPSGGGRLVVGILLGPVQLLQKIEVFCVPLNS